MGLLTFTRDDFCNHLVKLGVQQGMTLVVHSSLMAFGNIPGRQNTVYEILREVIGENGTIIVPTYTLTRNPNLPFCSWAEAPTGMGVLSTHIFGLKDSIRVANPIHSYAAVGFDAYKLKNVAIDKSFGNGSFFDLAVRDNFYWLMLGCGIDGCSLLHHTEFIANVPYRKEVILNRAIQEEDGAVKKIDYVYYARRSDSISNDFSAIENSMCISGEMISVNAPYGKSLAGFSSVIHQRGLEMLKLNPHEFYINKA